MDQSFVGSYEEPVLLGREDWDGDHCPEGVYVVLVCYKPRGETKRTVRDTVTLIR